MKEASSKCQAMHARVWVRTAESSFRERSQVRWLELLATSGIWLAPASDAQPTLTPEAALQELLAGNQRFAANRLTSIEHDLKILKEHTVDKQEPFAAVLACADSRVPVELVFDQSIGHIFVTRVAGNIVTPEIIASLEYAVAVLGIRALLVLGHRAVAQSRRQ